MPHVPQAITLAGAIALFSLSLAAVPAFAAPGKGEDCEKHPDNPGCSISINATPELDSIVLFGTGLLGAGGYALARFRARRRKVEHVESSAT